MLAELSLCKKYCHLPSITYEEVSLDVELGVTLMLGDGTLVEGVDGVVVDDITLGIDGVTLGSLDITFEIKFESPLDTLPVVELFPLLHETRLVVSIANRVINLNFAFIKSPLFFG